MDAVGNAHSLGTQMEKQTQGEKMNTRQLYYFLRAPYWTKKAWGIAGYLSRLPMSYYDRLLYEMALTALLCVVGAVVLLVLLT